MSNNLERFVDAQKDTYSRAYKEICNGRKETHWMWFIFPQIIGLGESEMSDYYAIKSEEEVVEYLNHEVLGPRLISITEALLNLSDVDAYSIFGGIDSLKLKSSMTLFYLVSENPLFASVLNKFYDGELDSHTVDMLNLLGGRKESKKMSLLDKLKSLC